MADTGWVTAGSGSTTTVSGGLAWNNPGNIVTANDSTYANSDTSTSLGFSPSNYLNATNFGFSIPSGSVILGVETLVRASAFYSGGGSVSTEVRAISGRLIVSGSATGADRYAENKVTWASNSGISNGIRGGESDLWGTPLTPAAVNAGNFGFRLQGEMSKSTSFRVHYIQMRIHFEEASGGGVLVNDGGIWKEGDAYVRDGGIWKPSQKYVRDGGVWKT